MLPLWLHNSSKYPNNLNLFIHLSLNLNNRYDTTTITILLMIIINKRMEVKFKRMPNPHNSNFTSKTNVVVAIRLWALPTPITNLKLSQRRLFDKVNILFTILFSTEFN